MTHWIPEPMETLDEFIDRKVEQYVPAPLCVSETALRQLKPVFLELHEALYLLQRTKSWIDNRVIPPRALQQELHEYLERVR